MMTKTSRSIDQNKIKLLCDSVCDNIDALLTHFDLEYRQNGRFISMSCPIHGGDNPSAMNLYPEGETYRGNWICRTHQCEKVFKSSIIGFIRGVLSHKQHGWTEEGNRTVPFADALKFASDFVSLDLDNLQVDKTQKNKQKFVSQVSILSVDASTQNSQQISRKKIRQLLNIPSQYFINRGFTEEILDKYDVGDCVNSNREMYNRAVVPIYDSAHSFMIGCTGRSLKEGLKPKWKHSDGFKAENTLYNFWYAKEHIAKLREVILVESPANVWKLEMAGIRNSVAVFGSNLSDKQKMLLDTSGAMTIVVITDSDEAGEEARKQIQKKCEKIYNIQHIRVSKNDIAELSIPEINTEIKNRVTHD